MLKDEQKNQQGLLIAHHDQQAIQEKLEEAKRELEAEGVALDRHKRETESDRGLINQLTDNVSLHQSKLILHYNYINSTIQNYNSKSIKRINI